MAGFNISSFFNNSKGGFGSINFSDYSLIKSGSYKKLMKSYYSQQKETTPKADKTTKKKTTEVKDTTGLSKMKSEADGLKAATEAFNKDDLWKQKDGAYDQDKVVSAVKKFASEYNDVLTQSSKVSSKDVTQQTGYMMSMTKTMSGSLSKVGVTVGADGKLSVDEEALKKADAKDVKALFSGSHSYVSQITNNASAIGSAAVRSSSMYSGNGTISSSLSGLFDKWI